MKSFFIIILVILLSISTYSIYKRESSSKKEELVFKTLVHSNLKDLALVLNTDIKTLIKKLKQKDIKIVDEKQSITQIALFNKRDSSYIIDLLVK